MKIFNSLTGKKEIFEPINPNQVRMYVCGMTVYDDTHIGHARTFVAFDLIVRYLRSRNYEVKYIRNITDVDDKIIDRAKELKVEPAELVDRYINSMNEDFSSLSMIEPDDQPRATENIDSIIRLIEILIKKGHAYVGESDVYFSAESFEDYGKLSKRKIEDMLSGARIDINLDKKNPVDFVLWKKDTAGMKWDSPWGPGRPGWHIECSAMSMDALGETFDIHGGGSDLKFPHHENEIAQSECVTGKEFAKIWMHTGSLRIDKEKMSKSLKNFITIKDALKANSAEVLRFFLISSHYRSPLNYSEELLKEAKSSLDRIYNSLDGLNLDSESANRSGYSKTFTDAMDDDFNTPAAIAILFEMTREINKLKKDEEIEKANNLGSELKMLSQSLGILQKNPADYFKSGVDLTDKEIENLIDQRSTARQNRDFALSDSIRDSLLEKGIILEDKETGTVWKKN